MLSFYLFTLFAIVVASPFVSGLSVIRTVLQDVRHDEEPSPSKPLVRSSSASSGCKCTGYNCGCCAHLDMPKVHINDTGCVNLTYLPTEYGIALTFTLDGKVIFKAKVSAKNPPPICFGVPHLKEYVSLCLRFYNLSADLSHFSGCVKVEARLYKVITEDIDLGCFHFGGEKDKLDWFKKEILTNQIFDQRFP